MKRILGTTVFSGLMLTAALVSPAQATPICGAEAADGASARKIAERCNTAVEILAERTEREQIFANPDGTRTLKSFAAPQRVRKDGVWKDIDTRLQRGKDGRLAPKAGADVSFSSGGTSPFAVTIVDGKRFELSWPGVLTAPAVAGDTATYPEVQPGVDLAVTATRTGFTHVLVIKTAAAAANPAIAKVQYKVSGDVSVRATGDGDLELVDKSGKVLPLGSHAASMWDSSADATRGGESKSALRLSKSDVSGPSELAAARPVTTLVEGDQLAVIPDAQLLKTGVLPLYIDPVWQPATTTWVYANNQNVNWTQGEHARVGRNPDDGRIFRSFFTFPLAGLAGKQVQSAAMWINLDHTAACAGNTAYAYSTTTQLGAAASRVPWSPALTNQLGSAFGQSNESGGCGMDQGDDMLYFTSSAFAGDVQSKVNAAVSHYTVGLCMCTNGSGAGETGTFQWMKFHHATAQFVVTYNATPAVPANLSTSDSACDSTLFTYAPVLKAQFADADGSPLTGQFEWKQLPSGATTTVASGTVASGAYGSVTLALDSSAENQTFSWRVSATDGTASSPWSNWCDFTISFP